MCRSENDPNGPYRCSADMLNALKSTRAHYASAIEDRNQIKASLDQLTAQVNDFREMVDREGVDVSKVWIERLETLEQQKLELEADYQRLSMKAGEWQDKLKEAQKNYDSTRGGIQDLCMEYNATLDKYNTGEDLTQEELDRLRVKADALKVRIDDALGIVKKERKKTWDQEAEREGATEGIDMNVINNQEDQESIPDGNEADVLIRPEVDEALNAMIDDLQLTGVDKKYMGIIDPDTGEMFDEHEIQVISRRTKREARLRLQRQREADGDTREMMRSFLRNAMYRALRYNKATKKIIRLVGIKHYNDFLEKFDDIMFEKKEAKISRSQEKWRVKRSRIADERFQELEADNETHRLRYLSKKAIFDSKVKEGSMDDTEYAKRMEELNSEHQRAIYWNEIEQTEIEHMRAQWAMEEADRIRIQERRMENIRQAMIQRKRDREATQEMIDSVRSA